MSTKALTRLLLLNGLILMLLCLGMHRFIQRLWNDQTRMATVSVEHRPVCYIPSCYAAYDVRERYLKSRLWDKTQPDVFEHVPYGAKFLMALLGEECMSPSLTRYFRVFEDNGCDAAPWLTDRIRELLLADDVEQARYVALMLCAAIHETPCANDAVYNSALCEEEICGTEDSRLIPYLRSRCGDYYANTPSVTQRPLGGLYARWD
jgi:hypothetical protein